MKGELILKEMFCCPLLHRPGSVPLPAMAKITHCQHYGQPDGLAKKTPCYMQTFAV